MLSSISSSSSAMYLSRSSMCWSSTPIILRCKGVSIPCRSSSIFSGSALSREMISSARRSRDITSPRTSALRILRPDLPFTLAIVPDSLMFAPSSIFCSRFSSRLFSPTRLRRYDTSSRSSLCALLGMKLLFSSPCWSKSAIHSASFWSVLRPGTAFICAAFTTMADISCDSSTLYSGFQYDAVLSMATI